MLSASEFAGPELLPPPPLERSRPLVRILFVLVAVLTLLASVSPASIAQTNAVSPEDAVLLTKVRQAGLWEMPSGMMAMQKGSPKVQAVGFAIMMAASTSRPARCRRSSTRRCPTSRRTSSAAGSSKR